MFESERLLGRDFAVEDAEACWAMWGDPEVMRFLGGVKEKDAVEMRATLEKVVAKYGAFHARGLGYHALALIEKDGGELIGCGLLKPIPDAEKVDTSDIEIGWHLLRKKWGHGLATEAGRALLRLGFSELPVDRLHAVVDVGNVRSQAVAERLGMTLVENTDRYYGRTLHHYVLARADWERRS